MDNANDKMPETGETKPTEISPELQVKLDEIKANQETLMKKDKKVAPLIAAVIVLLLISIVCVLFTAFNKGKNNGDIVDQNAKAKAPVETKMVESLEANNNLNERLYALNLINFGQGSQNNKNDNFAIADFAYTRNAELYSNLRLTDSDKLFITLASLSKGGEFEEKVSKTDFNASVVKEFDRDGTLKEADFLKYGTKVSAEKVASTYKDLFGEDVKHQSIKECGALGYYDAETKYYYSDPIGGCGGYDERKIVIRQYNNTESDDNYFVKVGVVTVFDGTNQSGKELCAIFDGFYNVDTSAWGYDMESDKVAKSCKPGDSASSILSAAGEEHLTHFLYTFDKDFHFKKIERL